VYELQATSYKCCAVGVGDELLRSHLSLVARSS